MVLQQSRLGHSVSGRIYLADPGVKQLPEYKRECRQAYGDLRGVTFHEFAPGTKLLLSTHSGHFWVRG